MTDADSSGALRIDHAVTSGTSSLDRRTFRVANNVWVLGDDDECIVIDAPHSTETVLDLVGDREVIAVVCTHAHDDHVQVAPEVADRADAPIWLHPHDRVLWDMTHPDRAPDGDLADGQRIDVGGETVTVIHTPGHTHGAVCLHVPALGVLFSGDTLSDNGPGATGGSYSDFPAILSSISGRLFTLADDTRVLTGHGEETTIGAQRPAYDDWVARGH